MISAFGVEHTEVSKGLPSALRGAVKGSSMRSQHQLAAHTYGKDVAHMKSTGFTDERTMAQGVNQKAKLRRIDMRRANTKNKTVLP